MSREGSFADDGGFARTSGARQLSWPRRGVAWAVVGALCFPAAVDVYLTSQYWAMALCLAAGLGVQLTRSSLGPRAAVLAAVALSLFLVVNLVVPANILTPAIVAQIGTFLLLVPLGVAYGVSVSQDQATLVELGRAYLVLALACIPFALYESVVETRLLPRLNPGQPELHRSVLAQDHPIILGLLFACAIPLLIGTTRVKRLLGSAALVVGTFATGSAGPQVVAIVGAFLVVFPGLRIWGGRHRILLAGVSLAGFIGLAYVSAAVWTPIINDTNVDEYSNGYRTAAYALAADILHDAPFGYGVQGIPPGKYLVMSEYLGVQDLADTIDAEPVLLVSQFGWLGVIAFVLAWLSFVREVAIRPRVALMGLMLMAGGFVVALHAWVSVTSGWAILLGISVTSFGKTPSRESTSRSEFARP